MADFRSMNDDEIHNLILQATAERDKRYATQSIPGQIDALNRQYLQFTGKPEGQEWTPPENGYEAYPHGWQVQHNGETWVSLRTMNQSVPGDGSNAWGVVVPDEGLPEWVQPTEDETRYSKGSLVVHSDKTWISRTDQNADEPGDGEWDEFDDEAEFENRRAMTPPQAPSEFTFARTEAWPSIHPVPPGMAPNPEDESPDSAHV